MRSYYYQRKKITRMLEMAKEGASLEEVIQGTLVEQGECERILEDLELRGKVLLAAGRYHLAKSSCTIRWDFRMPESIDQRVDRARGKSTKTAWIIQAALERLEREEGGQAA